jgi:uncharacterized protein YebE (UPF0316 family)
MEYYLCVKESGRNLMCIVSAREWDKPLYRGFVCLARADGEEEAFEMAAEMVREFCGGFWKKGLEPDFSGFKTWALKERAVKE